MLLQPISVTNCGSQGWWWGQGIVFKYNTGSGKTLISYEVAFVCRAATLRGSQWFVNPAATEQRNSKKSFIYVPILLEDTNYPLKDWQQSYFEGHDYVGMACSTSQEQFYGLFWSISWVRNPSSFQPVTTAHSGMATELNSCFEGELWGDRSSSISVCVWTWLHFPPSHLGNWEIAGKLHFLRQQDGDTFSSSKLAASPCAFW